MAKLIGAFQQLVVANVDQLTGAQLVKKYPSFYGT
jgi:hypothetical protein